MVGHLSLSRDNHSKDLVSSLHDFLEANSLVDCMLSADGQYLKAHKLILSACSPYFQLLFKEETDKYPIVVLKNIEFEYLKLIIDFVYCGEVQVFETQLNTFLEVAKYLQIKGLNADSRESTPERTFSELPGRTSISGNESNEIGTANEVILDDDDDCKVIDVADDTMSEVHEQPCVDRVESPMMITDESTFSLAPRANSASVPQSLINAADHEWHSRPVSPVSVTSITSVKTEQLIDCEEINVRSKSVSESENLIDEVVDSIESEQAPRVNGTKRPVDNPPSENAECVEKTDKTSTIAKQSNTAGKRACPPDSRSVSTTQKPSSSVRKEVSDGASCPSEDSDEASRPQSSARASARRCKSPREARGKYTCAVCNRSFEYRSWLEVHIRKHTGERPYQCKECDKTFAVAHNLKIHMVTHSRKRPHKCAKCDMHFASPARLKSHLKMHSGEKPFKCSACNYQTAYSSDLVRHKRRHTGERPYKCPECDYAAISSTHLNNHRRTHERARVAQAQAEAQAAPPQAAQPSSSSG